MRAASALVVALGLATSWLGSGTASASQGPVEVMIADASGGGGGIWVRGCTGTAEVAGDTTIEQAKQNALLKAKTEAARRAFGESIHDSFMDIIVQTGGQIFDTARRETFAEASALVIDYTEPRFDLKPIIVPGQSGKTVHIIQVVCLADFLVIRPPNVQRTFSVDLTIAPSELVSGTPLRLRLRSHEAVHVYVFNLAADLRVYQLYPNQYCPKLVARQGEWLDLPASDDPFELKPRTLPGHKTDVEVLRVVASRQAVASPASEADGTIRLRRFYDWLLGLAPGQWAQAEVTYTVHAAGKARP